jgi:diguanylate cyclase (GGDEF)-like protein
MRFPVGSSLTLARLRFLYIAALCVVAAAGAVAAIVLGPSQPPADPLAAYTILPALILLSGYFQIRGPDGAHYSTVVTFLIAAVLLVPPYAWIPMTALMPAMNWLRGRNPWYEEVANVALLLIACLAAYLVLAVGGWDSEEGAASSSQALVAFAAAGAFLVTNHVTMFLSLRVLRQASMAMLLRSEVETAVTEAVLLSTGIAFAYLFSSSPLVGLFAAAPLILAHRALYVPTLKLKAFRDPKTGLWNHDYFQEQLRLELARARRRGGNVAVVMADLDLLRQVNNNHGHLAGDRVINAVAEVIRDEVREDDVAARLGGEEFAVVLPDLTAREAYAVAQRIRLRVQGLALNDERGEHIQGVTISAGVAAFPEHAATHTALLHAADLAAYRAKSHGRNMVCLALSDDSSRAPIDFGLTEAAPAATPVPSVVDKSARAAEPTPSSPRLSASNALLVGSVIAVAIVAAAFALAREDGDPVWPSILVIALAACVSELASISLYGNTRVSISAILVIAAAILFGAEGGLVVAVAAGLGTYRRGVPAYRVAFSAAALAIASLLVVAVNEALQSANLPNWLEMLTIAVGVSLAYYVGNIAPFTLVVSRAAGENPVKFFNEKYRWLFPHFLAFGVLGYFVAEAYEIHGLLGMAVFALPPLMMRLALKQYISRTERDVVELQHKNSELESAQVQLTQLNKRVHSAYKETLGALIAALDARDSETEGHSERVAAYAIGVARQLGVAEGSEEWEAIERGSILHDVGKIGVPDAILRKPSALTPEEWVEMRKHPEYGYHMLNRASFLRAAADLVYCHHERYDGQGYPRGLKGEQIPLGARIFSAVDAYDAMTSGRPYRAAISPAEAMAELERCAGTQFDPVVVRAFRRSLGLPDKPGEHLGSISERYEAASKPPIRIAS